MIVSYLKRGFALRNELWSEKQWQRKRKKKKKWHYIFTIEEIDFLNHTWSEISIKDKEIC